MNTLEDRAKKFLDVQSYGALQPETRELWIAWLVSFAEKETAKLQPLKTCLEQIREITDEDDPESYIHDAPHDALEVIAYKVRQVLSQIEGGD